MSDLDLIIKNIKTSILLQERLCSDFIELNKIRFMVDEIATSYIMGGKIYFCGNGGSFADAQHLAAELTGRFYIDRPPLSAVLLGSNLSYTTAVANDYDYSRIFLREFQSSYSLRDILVVLSTSGKSSNVLEVVKFANKRTVKTLGLLGGGKSLIKDYCDLSINIPINDTARIQELHMLIGHTILQLVEKKLFNENSCDNTR